MSIQSLQSEVGKWHRSIFGEFSPELHVIAIAQKAQEEAGELRQNPWSREEVADLMICALAAADRLELDIEHDVNSKLFELIRRGSEQLKRDAERGIVQAKDMADGH
jgi:hypothetical protein